MARTIARFPSASSMRETKERSIFRMSIGKRWR